MKIMTANIYFTGDPTKMVVSSKPTYRTSKPKEYYQHYTKKSNRYRLCSHFSSTTTLEDIDDGLTNLNWLQNLSLPTSLSSQDSTNSNSNVFNKEESGDDKNAKENKENSAIDFKTQQYEDANRALQDIESKLLQLPTSVRKAQQTISEKRKNAQIYKSNPNLKPPYSYSNLICMSMRDSPTGKVTLSDIYFWIAENFAYYRHADPTWQNSVRHNLSLNRSFQKIPRSKNDRGKGSFWRINPDCADLLVDGIIKKRRHSSALRQKMRVSTPSNKNNTKRNIPPYTDPPLKTVTRQISQRESKRKRNPRLNEYLLNEDHLKNATSVKSRKKLFSSDSIYCHSPTSSDTSSSNISTQSEINIGTTKENNHDDKPVGRHRYHSVNGSCQSADLEKMGINWNALLSDAIDDGENNEENDIDLFEDVVNIGNGWPKVTQESFALDEGIKKEPITELNNTSPGSDFDSLFDDIQINDDILFNSDELLPSIDFLDGTELDLTIEGTSINQPNWWNNTVNQDESQHESPQTPPSSVGFVKTDSNNNIISQSFSFDENDIDRKDFIKYTMSSEAPRESKTSLSTINPSTSSLISDNTISPTDLLLSSSSSVAMTMTKADIESDAMKTTTSPYSDYYECNNPSSWNTSFMENDEVTPRPNTGSKNNRVVVAEEEVSSSTDITMTTKMLKKEIQDVTEQYNNNNFHYNLINNDNDYKLKVNDCLLSLTASRQKDPFSFMGGLDILTLDQ